MELKYNGAVLKEETLNAILKKAREYQILPSFLITQLHYEGLWGNSEVARLNSNLGGMTWTGTAQRPSGVVVSKGSPRPAAEGGHYMKYASLSDFIEDWTYLLRPDGYYNVYQENDFKYAVKGIFVVGGAQYDYATMNVATSQQRYELYLQGMTARRQAINVANNNSLDKLDQDYLHEGKQTVMKIDIDKAISFMRDLKAKGTTYSMYGSRTGADGSADCSGAIYAALRSAGASNLGQVASTESMHGWLVANGFKRIATNATWPAQKGDICIMGQIGHSANAGGHVWMFTSPTTVIHCSYKDGWNGGVYEEPETNVMGTYDYLGYWYVYRQEAKPVPLKSPAEIAKEVLDAKWGNGADRISKLQLAGYDPVAVQNEVNKLVEARDQKEIQVADHQPGQDGKVELADNEVLLNGIVYVITEK
ncbi:peptidoglycan amidohydrolase family protein [Aerococcus sp. UMB8608]|uniref:NlpC/P60 domain-containing protein n=1 Tax=Aerococcus sanguinicola TaxID=119206 RepID=A0A0X8FCN5_9LACT|nr:MULTISPECIES: peptidoglycan amidohydrolase family protein [Aerococcus]AMB94891.1 hypothetical protein AWM72_09050 [Aerococcus sanguinicola]MDK6679339.1 peptidoglycan amidohydrolase family protein [Aerococcus sp. UMB8608]MDK6685819.1 peptidoglycan amidohydrolase family protein [Aerococcus sp. UMB8623]OFT95876.1 hypothetical protein HMPREF3090_03385 [Aerococcus sp. HMSC23C02]